MEGLPMIGPCSMEVGRFAAQTLRSQGAHSFAFYGVKNADFSEATLRGFREGLGAFEEDCHLFLEEPGVFSHRELFEKQLAWIRKLPDGTAIYCPDDVFAHTVGCLAIQSGRRIPEDLTLLGTNNDETLCLGMQPPISSIRLPWRRIGYRAAEKLEECMEGGEPSEEPEFFGPPELVRRQSTPERHCHDPLVERAITLMHKHLTDPLTIEELAQEVGASRRSLEKRFRKTVDRSPLHEQNRIRLEEVKRLLREDSRTIEALSDVMGFSSPVYLHQFFQREAGMSPGAYRKSFSTHSDPR
jgi:LacI family transcriptional regulator